MKQKLLIQVYEHFSIEIVMNVNGDGYKFKTPKGLGGRHYYSFCNDIDEAFREQYPEAYYKMYSNLTKGA